MKPLFLLSEPTAIVMGRMNNRGPFYRWVPAWVFQVIEWTFSWCLLSVWYLKGLKKSQFCFLIQLDLLSVWTTIHTIFDLRLGLQKSLNVIGVFMLLDGSWCHLHIQ